MKMFRYRVARFLIHLGLDIMPECRYKTRLLQVLWELYYEVLADIEEEKGSNV